MEEEKKQSSDAKPETERVFLDLEHGKPTPDIESLCMNCEKNGVTKFMLTKIPFFKEIMVSAFQCDHCGMKNSEVSFAGKLEDYGVKYEVNVINNIAFDRTVVKSEFATIRVPEIGLEIPPATQKGSIKTIEGYFATTIAGLQDMQEERRKFDPITAQKIDDYCKTLQEYSTGKKLPFTFIVEDPSGNSFVQNPSAPTADQYCKKTTWIRNREEYEIMGYPVDQATLMAEQDRLQQADPNAAGPKTVVKEGKKTTQTKEEQEALLEKAQKHAVRADGAVVQAAGVDFGRSVSDQKAGNEAEVMKFPTPCSNCTAMGNVQMCTSSIPFFKEIIIMAFICDDCGYRNSEIKEGGGISDKAKKLTLNVSHPDLLNRDIFKSDTAKFTIKELGFDMEPGSLGSVYTTVEGLLVKLIDELTNNNPFGGGDSATDRKFLDFLDRLGEFKDGKKPFTLILDDAADNCFIYNPDAPNEDPHVEVHIYERTAEQNDDLGIADMQTEGYETKE